MRSRTSQTLAIVWVAACAAATSQAQTFKVLYNFQGGANGSSPEATPFFSKGNLYGTTSSGGERGGVLYELNVAAGTYTVLHTFIGSPNDASSPAGAMIQDAAGNLYGVAGGGTQYGGALFKFGTKGTTLHYSIAYNFNGNLDNAASTIEGPIARDSAGNVYGVAGGSIFKLDPLGNYTNLHLFGGAGDGAGPVGGLILENNVLYGATAGGGAGAGTVWQYDLASNQESVLWSFMGGADGDDPQGGVVSDGAGNLYGSTRNGGYAGARGGGTIYTVNIASKTEKLLHVLGPAEGPFPEGNLVRDPKGNLYGTTSFGGGSIFRVTPAGKYTTLYTLSGGIGKGTVTGLSRDDAGNLYGVTMAHGTGPCRNGCGTIFELTP